MFPTASELKGIRFCQNRYALESCKNTSRREICAIQTFINRLVLDEHHSTGDCFRCLECCEAEVDR